MHSPPDDEAKQNGLEIWDLPVWTTRERLLAGMARVIQQAGWEPFLRAPILEATPQWFPDPWSSDANGIRLILRRLLSYVGIMDVGINVEIKRSLRAEVFSPQGHGMGGAGACAWFMGWNGDVCSFGIDLSELEDPAALVGTLSHEICHAWRSHHGVAAMDRSVEEPLTDVTAVVLGFGALLLNSAYSFQANHIDRGGNAMSTVHQRGYLSPGEIAWLLAAQLDARSADSEEKKRVTRSLHANQQAALKRAQQEIDADPLPVRGLLKLPTPSQWPPSRQDLVVDLPDLPPMEAELGQDHALLSEETTAQIIVHSRVLLGIIVVVSVFACLTYFVYMEGDSIAIAVALIACCALGAGLGHLFPGRNCSNCKRGVARRATHCRYCQARFVATQSSEAGPRETEEQTDWSDDSFEARAILSAKAAFVQWAFRRGLVDEAFEKLHGELSESAVKGTAREEDLCRAIGTVSGLLWMTETGQKFARTYSRGNWELLLEEWLECGALGAAGDPQATRLRFEGWIERRWMAWLANNAPSLPHTQIQGGESYEPWTYQPDDWKPADWRKK